MLNRWVLLIIGWVFIIAALREVSSRFWKIFLYINLSLSIVSFIILGSIKSKLFISESPFFIIFLITGFVNFLCFPYLCYKGWDNLRNFFMKDPRL